MEPFDVLAGIDEVAQVHVLLRAEDRVVDERAVHARVGVHLEHGRLRVEALHVAQIEAHADVVAPAPGVLGVRRRRAVLGREQPDEDELLGERADLGPDLLPERARDEGGIDEVGRRHAWLEGYLLQ